MSWEQAERVAEAVLYEGYLLYPYRASALKNRKRWTFGEVPAGGSTGTELLLRGDARVRAKLRFLEETGGARDVLLDGPAGGAGRDFEGGAMTWSAEEVDGLRKLALRVESRGAAMISCHVLLGAEGGEWVSITDPRSRACAHRGLWPVLVAPDLVLASPILLPDHPSIAPESPRDLFDGTEIDEILSLRIRTLSDAEKEEIRGGDARARRLLERTEALTPEALAAMHGARRDAVRAGDRVRLRPSGRADILDLALAGREALVVAVEEDLEGRRYVAVTVADDPGRDLGQAGFPGHRFYFRPEEVEPL